MSSLEQDELGTLEMALITKIDKLLNKLSTRFYMPLMPGAVKDSALLKELSFRALGYSQQRILLSSVPEVAAISYESKSDLEKVDWETFRKDGCVKFVNTTLLDNIPSFDGTELVKQRSLQNKTSRTKSYFQNILTAEKPVENYGWFFDLAFDQQLTSALEKIAGKLYFCGGGVYLSTPPETAELEGSQKWHFDRFSKSHIKVFVNLTDVFEENGPTAFLGARRRAALGGMLTKVAYLLSKRRQAQAKLGVKSGMVIRNHQVFKQPR